MNHEFCGRRCARAWATDHGQPITGSLARPPTPDPNQPTIVMGTQPQNQNMGGQTQNQQMQGGGQSQNQQTGQGGNQPGQKRGGGKCLTYLVLGAFWQAGSDAFVDCVVKGFVKGFKSLVSSNPPQQQQPQQPQQQTVTNPAQTQHPPNNASNSTLNLGSHTIPLVLRIPTGPPNQHNNRGGVPSHNRGPNKLGPFNGAYPISPPSPSDDNTATQNKGPFNGAYPSNRWSSGASLPSQPTGGSSSSIPASKPRLGPFNGAYPISPPSPTDEGSASQNEDEKPKLGPFNGAYPIATPPTQSISSGISALQTPNDTTPGTTPDTTPGTTPAQGSDDVWKALSHRTHSTDSLSYASEEEDTGAVQDQASGHEQDAVKDGDEVAVDNEDEVAVDNADTASISYSVYPPSTVASDHEGICALEGCSEPVFVDPITDLESEYCSGKHQE